MLYRVTVVRSPPTRAALAPPRAAHAPAERRFRGDIQGLRAVAVLLVVLQHAGVTVLSGGYIGVDVFFVVSGFVISRSLLTRPHDKGISLAAFYAARARRILPMSTVVLLVTVLASWGLLNFVRAGQAASDAVSAAFFAANFRFAALGSDYFAAATPHSPVQHYWSLAVEEQFYLVWPLLMGGLLFGLPRRRHHHRAGAPRPDLARVAVGLGVIIVLSLLWSIKQTHDLSVAAFYSPLTRAWELGVGALLAVGVATVSRVPAGVRAGLSWAGLAGILASALLFTAATPLPGAAVLLPVLCTAAVIAGGTGSLPGGAELMLARRPLRAVGDCSYSFYLWHWPILVIAAGYAERELSLRANLVLMAGALLLSIATYQLIETPFRRGTWLRKGYLRSLALVPASAVVLLLVCALATPASRLPPPPPKKQDALVVEPPAGALTSERAADPITAAVQHAVAAAQAGKSVPVHLEPPLDKLSADLDPLVGCFAGRGQTRSKVCKLGDHRAERSVVIIGDSHAGMWVPALDAIGKRYGWAIYPVIKTSCASANVSADIGGKGPLQECNRWRDWALQTTIALHPDRVLMGNLLHGFLVDERGRPVRSWTGVTGQWRDGTAATARKLAAAGTKVTVLSDPPGVQKSPADCLLGRHATLASCLWPLRPAKQQLNQAVGQGASAAGAGFLDLEPWFCARGLCPTVIGSTVAYWDTTHVSRSYAMALAGPLARELQLDV